MNITGLINNQTEFDTMKNKTLNNFEIYIINSPVSDFDLLKNIAVTPGDIILRFDWSWTIIGNIKFLPIWEIYVLDGETYIKYIKKNTTSDFFVLPQEQFDFSTISIHKLNKTGAISGQVLKLVGNFLAWWDDNVTVSTKLIKHNILPLKENNLLNKLMN